MRRQLATIAAAGLAIALPLAPEARADYPSQPVSFVVPWPPGDLEDVITRLIADEFQARHGVPAAVVNRPGGGGGPFPGAIDVALAPADGYTIGSFVTDVAVSGHEIGIPELEPEQFDPVGIFLTYPFVIAASGNAPYGSIEELAEHAQANALLLGHFGAVLPPTRVTMALADVMGFQWGGDVAFDALDCNTLASGDADVINTTLQLILPCLDEVNVLVSITEERIGILPDTPAIGEVAAELEISLWNGLFVRKDTPQAVRDVIADVARDVVMGARAQEIAAQTGALVYWQDAGTAAARIASDMETVARIDAMLD